MNNNINVAVGGPINANYPKVYVTKFLKPTIPFALQVTEQNTKYVIKHNFDLGSETIAIPENCILEFDGGSLSNGNIGGNYINIIAGNYQIFHNIKFNAITFNNGLNVCWVGCKGDWVPGSTTYTDNTAPFLAALNTGLDLYIPDGKYGFNDTVDYQTYPSIDNRNGRRFISVIGESQKATWLVALFNNEEKDFLKITNGIYGEIKNIFITTSDSNRCRYGLYTAGLMNATTIYNVSIYGNFNWCYKHDGVIQYSKLDFCISRYPENNVVKNPVNGIYINATDGNVSYINGLDINLFLETYIGGEGIRIITSMGYALRIKALSEGNISSGGYFKLGSCRTLMYDSYYESVYSGATGFVFEDSKEVFLRNVAGASVSAINSSIIAQGASVNIQNDSNSLVVLDHVYPLKDNGLPAPKNDYSLRIRGGYNSNLHISSCYVGATLETDVSNLASNKYITTGKNRNTTLCGRGCQDKTHYHGFNNSVKCRGTISPGHTITNFYYADNIIDKQDAIKLRNEKFIAMSVLIKPDNTYYEMTALLMDLYSSTDNPWVFPANVAMSHGIILDDGWYQFIAIFDASRLDFTKPVSARFRGLARVGVGTIYDASYYITQIQVSSANGAIPRHFTVKNGESINCNIESGPTASRPAYLDVNTDVDLTYLDTDLSKLLTTKPFTVGIDTELKWVEEDGAVAGVSRSGNTASRPAGNDIYVGFMYMDTSLSPVRPIYASAISGDTVTWVDATGATV